MRRSVTGSYLKDMQLAKQLEEKAREEAAKQAPPIANVIMAQATKKARCSTCNGKIKVGFEIAICNKCQSVEHVACAKRVRKCGGCGASFDSP